MLGYHPVTGKEIRVIETDASLWRENKTLNYGNTTSVWETVYDGLLADGRGPEYRILLNVKLSDAKDFKKSKIVLVSNIESPEKFKTLNITNAIVLEEVHLMYPHLGGA
jgi:hypothetical protein